MRPYLFLLATLFAHSAAGQELLVNGDFEQENICSEYKVDCAPEAWIYTFPSYMYYLKDVVLSNSGSKSVMLLAGHQDKPFYRTYVRTRLLCGLRKGSRYRIQLYVRSRHPILDSVGVYFTPYDFLFEKRPYQQITPSRYLVNGTKKPARGDSLWQQVVLDYTADGTEAFLSIGFFNKAGLKGPTGIQLEKNYVFLVDDVSLKPLDPAEQLCADWKQRMEDILAQDERHEYLSRTILAWKKQPLQSVKQTPTIVPKVDTLIIPDLLFATGSAQLQKNSFPLLDSLLQRLSSASADSVIVEGHTDNTGSRELNEKLSSDRALAVAHYLRQKNPTLVLTTRSWASTRPAADNRTTEGRRRNRRVEIYVYRRGS